VQELEAGAGVAGPAGALSVPNANGGIVPHATASLASTLPPPAAAAVAAAAGNVPERAVAIGSPNQGTAVKVAGEMGNAAMQQQLHAMSQHLAEVQRALVESTRRQAAQYQEVKQRFSGVGARISALHNALSELGDDVATAEHKMQEVSSSRDARHKNNNNRRREATARTAGERERMDEDDDAAADMEDDNTRWLCESPEIPAASRSNVQPQPPPPPSQQQQQQQAQRQRPRAQPDASPRSHMDGLQLSARSAHSSDALPALRSPRKEESEPSAACGTTSSPRTAVITATDVTLLTKPHPVSASVAPQLVSPPFSAPTTQSAAEMPRVASGTATTTPLPTTSVAVTATAASIVDSPKKRQREASVAGATSPAASPAKRSLSSVNSLAGTAAGVRAMLSDLLRAPSEAKAKQCIEILAQWAARPAEASPRGGRCGSEEVTQVRVCVPCGCSCGSVHEEPHVPSVAANARLSLAHGRARACAAAGVDGDAGEVRGAAVGR
jgi:hypothetical protein